MNEARAQHSPQLVMILGTMQRSGTNFLSDALSMHRSCQQADFIYEDGVLRNAHFLEQYLHQVTRWWRPQWDRDGGVSEAFSQGLYNCCEEFLIDLGREGPSDAWPGETQYVVTKTPSVTNLGLIGHFKKTKVIVLIRDGRAVVQSGMKSFGWGFEEATLRWVASAEIVRKARHEGVDFHLVRYEDLVSSPQETFRSLFSYLELDAESFDYDKVGRLPVKGSSSWRGDGNEVHWSPVERAEGFDPLARFAGWSRRRSLSFSLMAGEVSREFDYDVPDLAAASLAWRFWGRAEYLRIACVMAYQQHFAWRIKRLRFRQWSIFTAR